MLSKIKSYPVDVMKTITIKENRVSKEAIDKINQLLYTNTNNYIQIYESFDTLWDSIKDSFNYGYRKIILNGKFTTRLEQYVWKVTGTKISDKILEQIGNIAAQSIIPEKNYTFCITDKIDWDDGDFGDMGSCYWRENQMAQKVLSDNDFRAIKLYNKNGDGIGRAWILGCKDYPVMFNCYGPGPSEFAAIISKEFSSKQKRVYVTNNGTSSNLLYINGGFGYLFYDSEEEIPDNIDFEIDIDHYLNDHVCTECGKKGIHRDNIYFVDDSHDILCYSCYSKKDRFLW